MFPAEDASEYWFGPIRFTSGDAIKCSTIVGVPYSIEVRVQGDKPFVYVAHEGWMRLDPEMARVFGQALMDAAAAVETRQKELNG